MADSKGHYLYPGTIFAHSEAYIVSTVLGSCVSTCLWDSVLRIGGINHYQLDLWNGSGLASPKYGNIAIEKLLDRMLQLGCEMSDLKAKVFGGASVFEGSNSYFNVGEKNIAIAKKMLNEHDIEIIASSVGGALGRKLKFNTESCVVMVKTISSP